MLELANGTTTIRDRSHCVIDPNQPQPDDTIDNILSSQGTYLKLIPKPQGAKGDDQQALDVMKQKYKARGEEVEIKAVIGDAILLETTLQKQLNSCPPPLNLIDSQTTGLQGCAKLPLLRLLQPQK